MCSHVGLQGKGFRASFIVKACLSSCLGSRSLVSLDSLHRRVEFLVTYRRYSYSSSLAWVSHPTSPQKTSILDSRAQVVAWAAAKAAKSLKPNKPIILLVSPFSRLKEPSAMQTTHKMLITLSMQMHREPDTALHKACTLYTLYTLYVYNSANVHSRETTPRTSDIPGPLSLEASDPMFPEPPTTLRWLGRLLRLLQRPGRDPECLGKRKRAFGGEPAWVFFWARRAFRVHA